MPEPHDREHQEHDDRSQRIEALRNLARQGDIQSAVPAGATDSSPATMPTPPVQSTPARRSRKPLLIAAISALVLIAVAGGLIARAIASRTSAMHQQRPFVSSVMHPGGNNAACPQDIAWSPDGATVAFLGYQLFCPSSDPAGYAYHAGSIVLYDVASGAVTTTIKPDPIIAAALGLKPPAIATPRPFSLPDDHDTSQQVIDYSHLLWSSDGKQLVATSRAFMASGRLNRTVATAPSRSRRTGDWPGAGVSVMASSCRARGGADFTCEAVHGIMRQNWRAPADRRPLAWTRVPSQNHA